MRIRNFFVCCFFVLLTVTAHAQTVKVGIFPSNDPTKLHQVMEFLAHYLHEKTGDDVRILVARDYQELADRLEEKSIDIAWINTVNYIHMKTENPSIKYIATYMEKNEHTGKRMPYYQAYIISLREKGFAGLKDIRGKLFAFTDPGSTSGYAYPHMLLRKQGIDHDSYFQKVFFLKRHDRVISALLSGAIDAGAVSDGTYFTAVHTNGDIFTVLAKSEPIPLDAIVVRENFDESRRVAYKNAFISMSSADPFCREMHKVLGWNAAGFQSLDDSFYNPARQALKK